MSRIANEQFDHSPNPTRPPNIADVVRQIEAEYPGDARIEHHGSAGAAAMGARQDDLQTRPRHAGPPRRPETHPA